MVPDTQGGFPPKFEIPAMPKWQRDEAEAEEARKLAARDVEPPAWSHIPSDRDGRFSGAEATETEKESGDAIEAQDSGPLKPGSLGHCVLDVYGDSERRTSYGASMIASGDFHSRRRESTRLIDRGFLRKDGWLPSPAPSGRKKVDAYVITRDGLRELERLGRYRRSE